MSGKSARRRIMAWHEQERLQYRFDRICSHLADPRHAAPDWGVRTDSSIREGGMDGGRVRAGVGGGEAKKEGRTCNGPAVVSAAVHSDQRFMILPASALAVLSVVIAG